MYFIQPEFVPTHYAKPAPNDTAPSYSTLHTTLTHFFCPHSFFLAHTPIFHPQRLVGWQKFPHKNQVNWILKCIKKTILKAIFHIESVLVRRPDQNFQISDKIPKFAPICSDSSWCQASIKFLFDLASKNAILPFFTDFYELNNHSPPISSHHGQPFHFDLSCDSELLQALTAINIYLEVSSANACHQGWVWVLHPRAKSLHISYN